MWCTGSGSGGVGRRARLVAALACSAVVAATGAAPGASAAPPAAAPPAAAPHVVVIAFDEFPLATLVTPSGQIDERLFPNFARLARLSTWYPRARTIAPRTAAAMPTLLDGRLPDVMGQARPGPDLFSTLGTVVPLHGERAADPLADAMPDCTTDGSCDESSRSAHLRRLIASLAPSDAGGLWYEHLLLPHQPWNLLPDGRRVESDTASLTTNLQWREDRTGTIAWHDHWLTSRAAVSTAVQRHVLQVEYADRLVGRLLDRLTATGMLRRTMVVVTADHGESFLAGRSARALNADAVALPEVLSVPLFIKGIDQRVGRRDDRPATIVDVLPTILDGVRRAGTPVPAVAAHETDGVSLLGSPRTEMPPLGGFTRPAGRVPDTEPDWSQLTRWRASFATLRVPRDAYRLGAAGDLVGRAMSAVAVTPNDPAAAVPTLHIPNRAQWDAVPASGHRFPAAVVSTADGVRRGDQVVVAVNGVVAGSGPVWRLDGSWRFQCIFDPAYLRPGANDVQAYLVRDATDGRTISPMAID